MSEFLKATFTRQKFEGLAISTALGNFAGYVAGSLVTLLSTYHSIERRALKNLFGILPRKKIVVHLLPEWLEWLLALVIGFLVMEFVRYAINQKRYLALLRVLRPARTPPAEAAPAAQPPAPPGAIDPPAQRRV